LPPGQLPLSIIESLLTRITNRLPCRIIDGEHGEPYLERYYLAGLDRLGLRGWHAYLHRFVDSDPDRGLHDHPWDRAVSLVLCGGYDELRWCEPPAAAAETVDDAPPAAPRIARRHVRPWRLNRLRGTDYHRVVLRGGRPAWTLFLHGPRVKGWGFRRDAVAQVMAENAADFRHRDWWLSAPTGREVRAARRAGDSSGARPERPETEHGIS
jgi:hypothetical protein